VTHKLYNVPVFDLQKLVVVLARLLSFCFSPMPQEDFLKLQLNTLGRGSIDMCQLQAPWPQKNSFESESRLRTRPEKEIFYHYDIDVLPGPMPLFTKRQFAAICPNVLEKGARIGSILTLPDTGNDKSVPPNFLKYNQALTLLIGRAKL
jgi:hypothetical protein